MEMTPTELARQKAKELFYQTEGSLPAARKLAREYADAYQSASDFKNAGFWGMVLNFLSLDKISVAFK